MTFPTVNFITQGYAWEFDPVYVRTQYSSMNSRQRKHMRKNNDVFSCRHVLTNSDTETMETYFNETLSKGSLTDVMPYYNSEVEYTGTGQIVNGRYSTRLAHNDLWDFTYTMEIIDRDLTEEQNIYEAINALSGFESSKLFFDALENMVNNNAL